MTKRLLITLILLVAGFCSIYALPKSYDLQKTALPGSLGITGKKYELPNLIGTWNGGDSREASDKEIKILAKDTQFVKKNFVRNNPSVNPKRPSPDATDFERAAAYSTYEEVDVSIVTSGSDMGNSIHRPERCLTAQGFDIRQEKKLVLQVRGKPLPVKRLVTTQHIKDEPSGKIFLHRNLTYYWFVGHYELTNDHYARTLMDIKDRVIKGYDQEWAYATVGMMLDPHRAELKSDGRTEGNPAVITRLIDNDIEDENGLTEADRIVQEFIIDLAKDVIDRKMIQAWNEPAANP